MSAFRLTYIKTMLNVLITDVKVVYDLNTLCENLKFNEDTRHDRYKRTTSRGSPFLRILLTVCFFQHFLALSAPL